MHCSGFCIGILLVLDDMKFRMIRVFLRPHQDSAVIDCMTMIIDEKMQAHTVVPYRNDFGKVFFFAIYFLLKQLPFYLLFFFFTYRLERCKSTLLIVQAPRSHDRPSLFFIFVLLRHGFYQLREQVHHMSFSPL